MTAYPEPIPASVGIPVNRPTERTDPIVEAAHAFLGALEARGYWTGFPGDEKVPAEWLATLFKIYDAADHRPVGDIPVSTKVEAFNRAVSHLAVLRGRK